MTGLFERAAPRGPGRVYSPRRMLGDLRRLLVRLERAYGRTTTDEARRWCRRVADDLERHILAGEAVLPGFADPRPGRRARKRRDSL